jgi:hypothetical protein
MASALTDYEPLLKWTRSLTAEQRALERRYEAETSIIRFTALVSPSTESREDHFPVRQG